MLLLVTVYCEYNAGYGQTEKREERDYGSILCAVLYNATAIVKNTNNVVFK